MKSYRFEIVRRKRRRFAWRVVALDGDRRDVLLSSAKTYRSRGQAKKGMKSLRFAKVVDTTRRQKSDGAERPTRFDEVRGVVPLVLTRHSAHGFAGRRRTTR